MGNCDSMEYREMDAKGTEVVLENQETTAEKVYDVGEKVQSPHKAYEGMFSDRTPLPDEEQLEIHLDTSLRHTFHVLKSDVIEPQIRSRIIWTDSRLEGITDSRPRAYDYDAFVKQDLLLVSGSGGASELTWLGLTKPQILTILYDTFSDEIPGYILICIADFFAEYRFVHTRKGLFGNKFTTSALCSHSWSDGLTMVAVYQSHADVYEYGQTLFGWGRGGSIDTDYRIWFSGVNRMMSHGVPPHEMCFGTGHWKNRSNWTMFKEKGVGKLTCISASLDFHTGKRLVVQEGVIGLDMQTSMQHKGKRHWSGSKFSIGVFSEIGGPGLDVSIAEIAVFSRALSEEQHAELHEHLMEKYKINR